MPGSGNKPQEADHPSMVRGHLLARIVVPLLLLLLLKHFTEIIDPHALVGNGGVEGRPSQFPSGHNSKALIHSHSQDVGAGTSSHTLAWPSFLPPFPVCFSGGSGTTWLLCFSSVCLSRFVVPSSQWEMPESTQCGSRASESGCLGLRWCRSRWCGLWQMPSIFSSFVYKPGR